MYELNKINLILTENRIKVHVFNPSNRKIWCVVGEQNEYWLDQNLNFCSCKGYYFTRLNQKMSCYHLKSVEIAYKNKNKNIDIVEFTDEEYDGFLLSVIHNLYD